MTDTKAGGREWKSLIDRTAFDIAQGEYQGYATTWANCMTEARALRERIVPLERAQADIEALNWRSGLAGHNDGERKADLRLRLDGDPTYQAYQQEMNDLKGELARVTDHAADAANQMAMYRRMMDWEIAMLRARTEERR